MEDNFTGFLYDRLPAWLNAESTSSKLFTQSTLPTHIKTQQQAAHDDLFMAVCEVTSLFIVYMLFFNSTPLVRIPALF